MNDSVCAVGNGTECKMVGKSLVTATLEKAKTCIFAEIVIHNRKVGIFRDECLNVNWFISLEDAQEVQVFKEEYWLQVRTVLCPKFHVIVLVHIHSNGPNFCTLG